MKNIKTDKLIIFGNGEFAKLAFHYFSEDSSYQVIAFCVDGQYIDSDTLFGIPVVSLDTVDKQFDPSHHHFYTAITYSNGNALRKLKYIEMKQRGYTPASYISSRAYVSSSAHLGEHLFMMEFVSIQPGAAVQNNAILWSGSQICHGASIEENVFIGCGAIIAGNSSIGENCLIGAGAVISERVSVAVRTIVGAGSVMIKNNLPDQIVVGVPAKAISHSFSSFFEKN